MIGTQPVKYHDAMWMVCITFLTVGYGDFYPVTQVGRIIAVTTVIVGQLYAATIIGIFSQQLQLTESDVSIYNFLENKVKSDLVRKYAANIIIYMWRSFKVKLEYEKKYSQMHNITFQGYFKPVKKGKKIIYKIQNPENV